MSNLLDPRRESSNHKLTAAFENRYRADRAMRIRVEGTSLRRRQLVMLDQGSAPTDRHLLPESHAIGRTLVRSHMLFGVVGAWVGILIFLVLNALGLPFVADHRIAAVLGLVHVSTLSGLMVGGLIALRPDPLPYIRAAQAALKAGQAVVIVHVISSDELDQARGILEEPAERIVATV